MPTASSALGLPALGITAGPDGNLWFIERDGNKIGRLIPGIDVTPAAADHFLVLAPASAVSGVPFDLTVGALDPYGNVDPSYRGTVTFTSSDTDPGVVLPADYTFTAGDAGTHTFTNTGLGETTLLTVGDQTITVRDPAGGLTGSATVTVGGGGGAAPRAHDPGPYPLVISYDPPPPGGGLTAGTGGSGGRAVRPSPGRADESSPADADLVHLLADAGAGAPVAEALALDVLTQAMYKCTSGRALAVDLAWAEALPALTPDLAWIS